MLNYLNLFDIGLNNFDNEQSKYKTELLIMKQDHMGVGVHGSELVYRKKKLLPFYLHVGEYF